MILSIICAAFFFVGIVWKDLPEETQKAYKKRVSDLVGMLLRKYKREEATGAGAKSGGHGIPFKKAGNELVQMANEEEDSILKELYKKEGKRLINKGKGHNHK